MNIYCEVCGQEMEFEEREMSPGHNEPCLIVIPCCMPEGKAEMVNYVVNEVAPRMQELILDIEDSLSELIVFADETDLSDCIITLKSEIKDLITMEVQ